MKGEMDDLSEKLAPLSFPDRLAYLAKHNRRELVFLAAGVLAILKLISAFVQSFL